MYVLYNVYKALYKNVLIILFWSLFGYHISVI